MAVLLTALLSPSGIDRELTQALRSAQISVEAGQAEPALEALEAALERQPDLPQLLPLAAEAALRSGRIDLAQHYLGQMAAFGIDPATSACQWARLHLQRGNLVATDSVLENAPACPGAIAELRRIALDAFERGDWPGAESAAVLALEHGARAGELEFLLIQLEAARQPQLALAPLRAFYNDLQTPPLLAADLLEALRSTAVRSDQAFRLATVGQVFARHGKWHLARLAFENAVAHDPGYTQARAYYGLALERTGHSGREVLLEALRRDPKHPLPLAFLGILFLERGQTGPARALIQSAHESDPEDPALLVQLAAAQASNGDLIAAQDSLLRAVNNAPDQPHLWIALAQFSIQWEIDLRDLGVTASRQALLLDSGSAQAADLLGYAHLLLGRPTIARRLSQRAVQSDPRLTSAWYHLGLASLELGEIEAARSALEHVQAMDPNSPTSELARRVLARLP